MQESFEQIIQKLRPEYDREISMHGACIDHTLVVLDDDPTGCQTVHDVPVVFCWDVATLTHYLSRETRMLFILVNTRSMPEEEAVNIISEVMKNLRLASSSAGRKFLVISRSDSTLRGHYPAEVDTIEQQLGDGKYMHCLVPAFFPGGRYTYEDIHYVREGDNMIPAAATPFAADKAFGYRHSHLGRYIEEKTRGHISAGQVLSFSVDEMREKGPAWVKETLIHSTAPACIVNAMAQSDLDVFAAGAWEAILEGKQMIFRTGASFLNAIGCIPVKSLLERNSLRSTGSNGGLFIVGSYVPKTSTQLLPLLESAAITALELPVREILTGDRDGIIGSMVSRVEQLINSGRHVLVYTSRKLVDAGEVHVNPYQGSRASSDLPDLQTGRQEFVAATDLQIGQQVSSALVELVATLNTAPSFIIAKGGITSHDVASKGLGIRRSTVIGQALPGVPLLVPDDRPDLKYIIFPGNVGDEMALMTLFMKIIQ